MLEVTIRQENTKGYTTPTNQFYCPMCIYRILPDLDLGYVVAETMVHMTRFHQVHQDKIRIIKELDGVVT